MNRTDRMASLLSQIRSERDLLLALLPAVAVPIRRIDPVSMPDSGLCAAQEDPVRQGEMPSPLLPSPGFYLDHLATGAVVLVRCLGLPASTVYSIALSSQQRLATGGMTGVYLVSCTDIADLVTEGFTVEVLPPSDSADRLGTTPAQAEFLSFVLAKYDPAEVIDLGTPIPGPWPAP